MMHNLRSFLLGSLWMLSHSHWLCYTVCSRSVPSFSLLFKVLFDVRLNVAI